MSGKPELNRGARSGSADMTGTGFGWSAMAGKCPMFGECAMPGQPATAEASAIAESRVPAGVVARHALTPAVVVPAMTPLVAVTDPAAANGTRAIVGISDIAIDIAGRAIVVPGVRRPVPGDCIEIAVAGGVEGLSATERRFATSGERSADDDHKCHRHMCRGSIVFHRSRRPSLADEGERVTRVRGRMAVAVLFNRQAIQPNWG
jgi:hypothetical protein